jgi:hypothetical protein
MRILNRMAVDKYRLLIIFIPEHGCPNSINKQRGRNKKIRISDGSFASGDTGTRGMVDKDFPLR